MITERVLKSLEYYKILEKVAEFAVLDCSKAELGKYRPFDNITEIEISLNMTEEADRLLYSHGVSGIEFFDPITDEIERARKGFSLNMAELLRVARLLKSSRLTKNSIISIEDEKVVLLNNIAQDIFTDKYLENDIFEKILSEDRMSDRASETLFQIRKKIKRINEQIRDKLNSFLRGQNSKFLQDSLITMRGDRYVIPLKAEYKGQIKGFVHDQSSSGATLFIEPNEVLDLNNDLKLATIEEQNEIEKILYDLSHSAGLIGEGLQRNINYISELDICFAKAIFAYKTKSTKPEINERGYIKIKKGRHPLIDADKVVPLDIELGNGYNFLLITGPNTGGKTVTLKLVGLFCLMAMSGLYICAVANSQMSVFNGVWTDIGDEQSIEQNLSTFSSHMKNTIEITEKADEKSLVLLDEIGAGTDPEEGSALAQAVIKRLIERGSFGIITTHYSKLKEYAYVEPQLKNASMDFDAESFAPLYKINIGIPGSSNAIEISKRLGLSNEISDYACSLLSENKISFENVLKEAEKSRLEAENIKLEYDKLLIETEKGYKELSAEKQRFEEEKQRFYTTAKAESRKIVNEKTEEAEALLDELKEIYNKDCISSADIIKASTLKNKIESKKYHGDNTEKPVQALKKATLNTVKIGDIVYVSTIGNYGEILRVSEKKREAEVLIGSIKSMVKIDSLYLSNLERKKEGPTVKIVRDKEAPLTVNEINVIGQNTDEALMNVENFLDKCVMLNLEEARIVHGVGLRILSSAIHQYLKSHPRVSEFRFGKYGEGEHGVTLVKFR